MNSSIKDLMFEITELLKSIVEGLDSINTSINDLTEVMVDDNRA